MSKKLIALLAGGLGNQMFQYAAARHIAEKTNSELFVDTSTGFLLDYKYRRKYGLNGFNIKAQPATLFQRIPIILQLIQNGGINIVEKRIKIPKPVTQRLYGKILVEDRRSVVDDVLNYRAETTTWMIGYWQSYLYFKGSERIVYNELRPPTPKDSSVISLGNLMRCNNSIAVGVRLYEESSNPGSHSRTGELKSVDEIRRVVQKMQAIYSDGRFFIFCTHRHPILEQIGLPKDSFYVTHDDGFGNTNDRLWLLSQCCHHIFTNSSFYWWGAWLSSMDREKGGQKIFAADNFVNSNQLLPEWEPF
jgi:hypothetical protein